MTSPPKDSSSHRRSSSSHESGLCCFCVHPQGHYCQLLPSHLRPQPSFSSVIFQWLGKFFMAFGKSVCFCWGSPSRSHPGEVTPPSQPQWLTIHEWSVDAASACKLSLSLSGNGCEKAGDIAGHLIVFSEKRSSCYSAGKVENDISQPSHSLAWGNKIQQLIDY